VKKTIIMAVIIITILGTAVWAAEEELRPKNPVLPLILNIIPGLGIGSFVMGDPAGGFIGLGGEIIGIGLVTYGFAYIIAETTGAVLASALTLGLADPSMEIPRAAGASITIGLLLWGGTRIFEIIRPFWFAGSFNERLKSSRKTQKLSAFIMLKTVNNRNNNNFEPVLTLKYSY